MSERVSRPSEADKCNWASGGSAYPNADPGAPVRDVGYKPKDYPVAGAGAVIPAEDHNFLWRLGMEMLSWLRDFVPREWTELSEGIAATTYRGTFRVVPSGASKLSARLSKAWAKTSIASGVGNPSDICTDGARVYYYAGTGNEYIVAMDAATTATKWVIQTPGNAVVAMTTDGYKVYSVSGAGNPGLLQRDVADGGNATAGTTTEYGHVKLRANGLTCCGIAGNNGPGFVDMFDVDPPALRWSVDTTSPQLNALALDQQYVYVGGSRIGGSDVWAYDTVSGAPLWQSAVDANAPPSLNGICTDGDYVYVATDTFATVAGPNRNVFCFERLTGNLLWSLDLGGNMSDCAVDQDYLYVLEDSATTLHMLKLRGSAVPGEVEQDTDSVNRVACDGTSVYVRVGSLATDVKRLYAGGASRTFMKVNGFDNYRQPLFCLAVPVDRP